MVAFSCLQSIPSSLLPSCFSRYDFGPVWLSSGNLKHFRVYGYTVRIMLTVVCISGSQMAALRRKLRFVWAFPNIIQSIGNPPGVVSFSTLCTFLGCFFCLCYTLVYYLSMETLLKGSVAIYLIERWVVKFFDLFNKCLLYLWGCIATYTLLHLQFHKRCRSKALEFIVCTRHLLTVKIHSGDSLKLQAWNRHVKPQEYFLQEYFLFFLLYALTCVSWILNSSNCPGCIDSIHANKARWGFRVFGLHQGGTSSIGYQVTIVCPKIWKCRTASFNWWGISTISSCGTYI